MSTIASAPSVRDAARPHTQRFRRAANALTLSPEQRRRQGSISGAAWRSLGSREAVMAFFNTHDETLGGRPLDLAVDSERGHAEVAALLLTLASAKRTPG